MASIRYVLSHWRTLVLFLLPILLVPLPAAIKSESSQVAYVLLLMAGYWITEALPTAVTALIPAILFPFLGIISLKEIPSIYFTHLTFMFLGAMIAAVAIENSGVHKRLALKMLLMFGTKPKWLLMGFMLPTWFLSMWIANTATTAMMMPVAAAVIGELGNYVTKPEHEMEELTGDNGMAVNKEADSNVESSNHTSDHTLLEKKSDTLERMEQGKYQHRPLSEAISKTEYDKLSKALCLCVCYSANIGGTASLTGTGPNLILKGQADIAFQNHGFESGVNFTTWMIFGFPGALIALAFAWVWLQIHYLGITSLWRGSSNPEREKRLADVIRKEYNALKSPSFLEITAIIHFVVLIVLWFTRDPGIFPGWGVLFKEHYVTDGSSALLVSFSLFCMPARPPWFLRRQTDQEEEGEATPLITWKSAESRLPWGIFILLGGGFALAEASNRSGLSSWLGDNMSSLGDLPGWSVVLILVTVTAASTEITTNSAMTSLLLPIVAKMAESIGTNPLYLMFPVAIAASFAFMLPVATPPNAISYSYGYVSIADMCKAGIVMNLICILIVTLATHTWGMSFFNLDVIPWENNTLPLVGIP